MNGQDISQTQKTRQWRANQKRIAIAGLGLAITLLTTGIVMVAQWRF